MNLEDLEKRERLNPEIRRIGMLIERQKDGTWESADLVIWRPPKRTSNVNVGGRKGI